VSLAARSVIAATLLVCLAAGAAEALIVERFGVVPGLAVPAAAAITVVVVRRPVLGAQLALLAVPLEYFSLRVGGEVGLTPTELLLLLTALAALARWSATGSGPDVPPALRALGALCVVILLGYAVAEDQLIVTKILLMWSAFVVVGVLVANADVREIGRLLSCLAIAGGVAGFVAVSGAADQQLVAGGLIATNRAQAGFAQPNVLGFFLVMAIPTAVVLSMRGKPSFRVLMALMAIGGIWGLMLSLSRTSLVGTSLGLGVLLLLPEVRRLAAVGIAALSVFALFNVQALQESQQVSVVTERVATLGRSDVVAADPRLEIYATTPSIVGEHPLLGVGAGNYSVAARSYGVLDENDQPFDHAHNVPLTIAAELGLVGLLIFTWFLVALAGLVWRALRARADPPVDVLLLAATAGLVGSALTCMGDYPPRTNVIAATLFALVGVLAGLLRHAETSRPS
jgi:O-antigen ligase